MFKSLQATIFCFAAVILAIILISSSFTGNRKTEELSRQLQSLQEQNTAQEEALQKGKEALEVTQTENSLLSEQLKQEKVKAEKTDKKLLEITAKYEAAQKQFEANAKNLAELQNQLAVSRQLASNAVKPEEMKKLQQEAADLKAQIDNLETERKVLLGNARVNAEKCIVAEKKLKVAQDALKKALTR